MDTTELRILDNDTCIINKNIYIFLQCFVSFFNLLSSSDEKETEEILKSMYKVLKGF